MENSSLIAGTALHGGAYKIIQSLGQGSFGITYLAEHTALGKKVCIKEFFMKELNSRSEDGSITGLSDGSLSYNYAQKFRKEAQNLARMDHPNIVSVTDCFDENGTFYYVMEYIEGQDLNRYLKQHSMTEAEAVSIISDVADALIYMHEEKRMLHLDLKPGNVMRRNSDEHIFLIDFGLSKHFSAEGQPETSTTIGLGTAGYAPIEQSNQAKNGEFRPTIDVYALGATLYKLLTRQTPPPASELVSDEDLLRDEMQKKGVSERLIGVVEKAMTPNVRKRTQTVRDFKNSLSLLQEEGRNASVNEEATSILQSIEVEEDVADDSTKVQEPIVSNAQSVFTRFFTKYATPIMIIAGLMFTFWGICDIMHYDYAGTWFGSFVLIEFIELLMIYTLGVKLISCNKWYMVIATICKALSIVTFITYFFPVSYDGILYFFVLYSRYAILVLMIVFLIGVILAVHAIDRVVFGLLMMCQGTIFFSEWLCYDMHIIEIQNWDVIGITEKLMCLLAIALYFYSEKRKKALTI